MALQIDQYYFSQKNKLFWNLENKGLSKKTKFIDAIPGIVIVKMIDKKAQSALMLKLKFVRNTTSLDITNISFETVILIWKKC